MTLQTLSRQNAYIENRFELVSSSQAVWTVDSNDISYLTALPDSIVPLTGQFIQEVGVVMEENIQDVLEELHPLIKPATNILNS